MNGAVPSWLENLSIDLGVLAAITVSIGVLWRTVIRPVARWGSRLEAAVSEVPALRADIVTLTEDLADQRAATRAEWERALEEFRAENTRQHADNLAAFTARLDAIEDAITRPRSRKPRTSPEEDAA